MSLLEHHKGLFNLFTVFRGPDRLHLVQMVNQSFLLVRPFHLNKGRPSIADISAPSLVPFALTPQDT